MTSEFNDIELAGLTAAELEELSEFLDPDVCAVHRSYHSTPIPHSYHVICNVKCHIQCASNLT